MTQTMYRNRPSCKEILENSGNWNIELKDVVIQDKYPRHDEQTSPLDRYIQFHIRHDSQIGQRNMESNF